MNKLPPELNDFLRNTLLVVLFLLSSLNFHIFGLVYAEDYQETLTLIALIYLFTPVVYFYSRKLMKNSKRPREVFVYGGFFIFIFSVFIQDFLIEYNCNLTDENSYNKAREYSLKINYPPEFLKKKGYEMDNCEYGFEYESYEHFLLFIVSSDGTVRLSD